MVGLGNHVTEGAQVFGGKHLFDFGEDAANFPAAVKNFFIGECVGVFRLANPRNVEFAALEAVNVVGVAVRANQFVVAASNKFQQVIEKFGYIGGANEIVELQLGQTLAKIDPDILVVQNAEIFVIPDQQVVAIAMKRGDLDARTGRP